MASADRPGIHSLDIPSERQENKDVVIWKGRKDKLNSAVENEYREKFKDLPSKICDEVPSINITMVGETGAGKSSILNTFVTAVSGSEEIIQYYRVSAFNTNRSILEDSTTKTLHLQPILCNGKKLPINFCDCPGVAKGSNVQINELEMVLNGELKKNVMVKDAESMRLDPRSVRKVQSFADQIHCLIYVIRATSNLYPEDQEDALNIIKEVRRNRKADLPQFVIVTAIDCNGVPNEDMENALLKYPHIKHFCLRVSEALNIPMMSIFPVSNYVEEAEPNSAKNALSLMAMWHIIKDGEDYIRESNHSTNPVNYRIMSFPST